MLKEKIPKLFYKGTDYSTALADLEEKVWTQAAAPNTACWSIDWLHNVPLTFTDDGTAVVKVWTLTECQAAINSFFVDESAHLLYLHNATGGDPALANPNEISMTPVHPLACTYSLLETRAEGMPKPILYGTKKGIVPVCINVDTLIYQWQMYPSYELVSVESEGEILAENSEYTKDLVASTIQVTGTPLLQPNSWYWFVFSGTFPVSNTDYMRFCGSTPAGGYSGGHWWTYDSDTGLWSEKSNCIMYHVYGKKTLDGKETMRQEYVYWKNSNGVSVWNKNFHLRDDNLRTRFAQKFKTKNNVPFYLTKIVTYCEPYGNPEGEMSVTIYDALEGTETPVGGPSPAVNAPDCAGTVRFLSRGVPSNITLTATGKINSASAPYGVAGTPIKNVADVIHDSYYNVLSGTAGTLDSVTLQALGPLRTQQLAIYLDTEQEYGAFLTKLEAGQLFKFINSMAKTYKIGVASSSDPAPTADHTFRDEDFKSFSSNRNWKAVFQKIQINYDSDSATHQEPKTYEVESALANLLYRNKETLVVDTYLKQEADAIALATAYSNLLQAPIYTIEFEVAGGYGLNLVPFDVVKIYRDRADSVTGSLDGVLFRVFSATKSVITGLTKVFAVLDTQTYYEA
jgi:hypothetical protein